MAEDTFVKMIKEVRIRASQICREYGEAGTSILYTNSDGFHVTERDEVMAKYKAEQMAIELALKDIDNIRFEK